LIDTLRLKEFRTFEDYCVVKWNLSRDYVNKNIRALGVLNNLDTMVSKYFEMLKHLNFLNKT
jgi:hypothetical protein